MNELPNECHKDLALQVTDAFFTSVYKILKVQPNQQVDSQHALIIIEACEEIIDRLKMELDIISSKKYEGV